MSESTGLTLESLLAHAIKIGASDIHIAELEHLAFRVHGELGKLTGSPELTAAQCASLMNELYHGDMVKISAFKERRDADFAYLSADGTPFRVNGFYKLGKLGFVMRRIEREARRMGDL